MRNNGTEPVLETYEDLNGLPCILIVCEKGKMGDSFPESFKYYDLRLRYSNVPKSRSATVQDLGRAFGYCSEQNAPVILVGTGCMHKLKNRQHRRGKQVDPGILTIDPDPDKMAPVDSNNRQHPKPEEGEFDTTKYREHWKATKPHFDAGNQSKAGWIQNPRRFLLFGLPQIGKTGAYLHLIYLLWGAVGGSTEPQEVEVDPDPEPEDDDVGEDDNMGPYPDFHSLKKLQFPKANTVGGVCHRPGEAHELKLADVLFEYPNLNGSCPCYSRRADGQPANLATEERTAGGCTMHVPNCGKYGDPKALCLWRHNIQNPPEPWACHPDEHKFRKSVLRKAPASAVRQASLPMASDAGRLIPVSANTVGAPPTATVLAGSSQAVQVTDVGDVWNVEARAYARFCAQKAKPKFHSENGLVPRNQAKESGIEIAFEDLTANYGHKATTGRLHIPVVHEKLWKKDKTSHRRGRCEWSLNLQDGENVLTMPIFTPSAGRFKPDKSQAMLDISEMMGTSKTYVQIVAVKSTEIDEYKANFPEHTFFELPKEADNLAIGASRYYIKQLSHILSDPNFPYCVVLDDLTHFWKVATLIKDRNPPRGPAFGSQTVSSEKTMFEDIRMWDVLRHFEYGFRQKLVNVKPDESIALFGFHKHVSKHVGTSRAYARKHVTSAVIMNLRLLETVEYRMRARKMEDLAFNRDVAKQGLVVCKCYRWQFAKPNPQKGGATQDQAHGMWATRPDGGAVAPASSAISGSATDPEIGLGSGQERPGPSPTSSVATIASHPIPKPTSTVSEVHGWILSLDIPGREEIAEAARKQEVDGDTLFLFKDNLGIQQGLGIALGRATKLWREIQALEKD
eukprot:COSAG01_NODE_4882_length_4653_cov_5.709550_2_plen_850_part_00